MAKLVEWWLEDILYLYASEIDDEPLFSTRLHNGYLFGEILRKYNYISDDQLLVLKSTSDPSDCRHNMEYIDEWLTQAGLIVPIEELEAVAAQKPGAALNFVYRLYFLLNKLDVQADEDDEDRECVEEEDEYENEENGEINDGEGEINTSPKPRRPLRPKRWASKVSTTASSKQILEPLGRPPSPPPTFGNDNAEEMAKQIAKELEEKVFNRIEVTESGSVRKSADYNVSQSDSDELVMPVKPMINTGVSPEVSVLFKSRYASAVPIRESGNDQEMERCPKKFTHKDFEAGRVFFLLKSQQIARKKIEERHAKRHESNQCFQLNCPPPPPKPIAADVLEKDREIKEKIQELEKQRSIYNSMMEMSQYDSQVERGCYGDSRNESKAIKCKGDGNQFNMEQMRRKVSMMKYRRKLSDKRKIERRRFRRRAEHQAMTAIQVKAENEYLDYVMRKAFDRGRNEHHVYSFIDQCFGNRRHFLDQHSADEELTRKFSQDINHRQFRLDKMTSELEERMKELNNKYAKTVIRKLESAHDEMVRDTMLQTVDDVIEDLLDATWDIIARRWSDAVNARHTDTSSDEDSSEDTSEGSEANSEDDDDDEDGEDEDDPDGDEQGDEEDGAMEGEDDQTHHFSKLLESELTEAKTLMLKKAAHSHAEKVDSIYDDSSVNSPSLYNASAEEEEGEDEF